MLEKKSIVSVKCSDIMSDQNVKLARHIQNSGGQRQMTECYFQLWYCVIVLQLQTKSLIASQKKDVSLVCVRHLTNINNYEMKKSRKAA